MPSRKRSIKGTLKGTLYSFRARVRGFWGFRVQSSRLKDSKQRDLLVMSCGSRPRAPW